MPLASHEHYIGTITSSRKFPLGFEKKLTTRATILSAMSSEQRMRLNLETASAMYLDLMTAVLWAAVRTWETENMTVKEMVSSKGEEEFNKLSAKFLEFVNRQMEEAIKEKQ